MSKIFTNQISTTSGTTFNLPKVDGAANTMLATDGSGNLKFVNQISLNVVDTLTPADSTNIWGSVITQSARQNDYSFSSFTSSGPWTTYYHSRSAHKVGTFSWVMHFPSKRVHTRCQVTIPDVDKDNNYLLIITV